MEFGDSQGLGYFNIFRQSNQHYEKTSNGYQFNSFINPFNLFILPFFFIFFIIAVVAFDNYIIAGIGLIFWCIQVLVEFRRYNEGASAAKVTIEKSHGSGAVSASVITKTVNSETSDIVSSVLSVRYEQIPMRTNRAMALRTRGIAAARGVSGHLIFVHSAGEQRVPVLDTFTNGESILAFVSLLNTLCGVSVQAQNTAGGAVVPTGVQMMPVQAGAGQLVYNLPPGAVVVNPPPGGGLPIAPAPGFAPVSGGYAPAPTADPYGAPPQYSTVGNLPHQNYTTGSTGPSY